MAETRLNVSAPHDEAELMTTVEPQRITRPRLRVEGFSYSGGRLYIAAAGASATDKRYVSHHPHNARNAPDAQPQVAMSTPSQDHDLHTHYCFSCLPCTTPVEGFDMPVYRVAYSRPSELPELSKETVWRAITHFKGYLKSGRYQFVRYLASLSNDKTRALSRWRSAMAASAQQTNLDGRRIDLPRTQWSSELVFDCTMHENESTFEAPAGPGKTRTEVWRMYKIQPPWSSLMVSGSNLDPLAQAFGLLHCQLGSRFYAPAHTLDNCLEALRTATESSPTMLQHKKRCQFSSCEHLRSAVGFLARDWVGGNVDRGEHGVVSIWQVPPAAIASLAAARVVYGLRSAHPQLRELTYDVYTSKEIYDACADWMTLSADEPPR